MNKIKLPVFLQIFAIILYSFMILFSIVIQPINLMLGIFCILILPGYNLLKIFKPQFNHIQKLGYLTILSLGIENVLMFFTYIFLYDLVTTPDQPNFFFNTTLLIISIQIFNIITLIINQLSLLRKKKKSNNYNKAKTQLNKENSYLDLKIIKNKLNWRILLTFIIFLISLILLCLSAYYSNVQENEFLVNYFVYRSNFTFFLRVPLIFYIFLFISIVSFAYIILFAKNNYFKICSISLFLYILWILPYLQINNYFGWDSHWLYDLYNSYINSGIMTHSSFNLVIFDFESLRYSTSLFTTILLVNTTNCSLNFTLWYIYPLIYVSIPFFFYSTFKKYSNKKDEISNNSNLFILTIIAVISPQFIKFAHTAITGVIGTYIFLILAVEFYFLVNQKYFNKKDMFIIAFLFLFLSLTHPEECIYFLILVFLYGIYQIFSYQKNRRYKEFLKEKDIKNKLFMYILLLTSLLLIFYLTQEFFGSIRLYIDMISQGKNLFLDFILNLYINSKFSFIPSLRGTFTISAFFIIAIFIGVILLYFTIYLLAFKNDRLISKITEIGFIFIKRVHELINKMISKKSFQLIIFFLIYSGLFLINWFYFPFLKEKGILVIIELIFSSSIFIFNIYLFIFGIKYYKRNNNVQNYYLLAMFASSSVFIIFFIVGNYILWIYELVSRFFAIFIFFNLIIICSNQPNVYMNNRKALKMIYLILLLSLGVIYSLRVLSYG